MLREYEKAKVQHMKSHQHSQSPDFHSTTHSKAQFSRNETGNPIMFSSKQDHLDIDPMMNVTRPTFSHMVHQRSLVTSGTNFRFGQTMAFGDKFVPNNRF